MDKRFILVFLLISWMLAPIQSGLAQTDSTTKQEFWFLDYGYGGIIAHNQQVYHLAQSHPRFFGFEYSRKDPSPEWSRAYKMPKVGVAIQYFDYQNPSNLGSSLAGLVFMEPRLWQNFTYRLGSGMVYNFFPFNLENNQKNLMLGSRMALVMHGQLSYYQKLHPKLGIRAGIGLTHFSNGAFAQPNSGINVFFASLGVYYSTQKESNQIAPSPPFQKTSSFQLQLVGMFSLVEKFPVSGPKFPVYGGSARGSYRWGRKTSIGISTDYSYNGSRAKLIEEKPRFGPSEGRIGIALGHELHISRISLMTDFGIYVYKKQTIDPEMYQRYGFRYYVNPRLFGLGILKVHRSKAECFEVGIGYSVWRSKK